MKKLHFAFMALVCILAVQVAQAQKSSVILKGGVNLANISNSENGDVSDARMLTSWHAGGVIDLAILDVLSIQPGLLYTSKGIKTERNLPLLGTTTTTFNPQYIELPLNLVFKAPISETSRFFAGAGPYAAMGVAGKYKVKSDLGSREYDIEFNDDDPLTQEQEDAGAYKVRKFDYGVNILAGLELDRFVISANYGLGLAKIYAADDNNDNDKNKHRVFSVSVGIKF
ncbi:porin family protein [Terrimonas rubra]|uniref:Porin family protein n=1 Tax=Terrimonas rubra TaxID=1035890 RepID=A0ABW6A9S8_9BACT